MSFVDDLRKKTDMANQPVVDDTERKFERRINFLNESFIECIKTVSSECASEGRSSVSGYCSWEYWEGRTLYNLFKTTAEVHYNINDYLQSDVSVEYFHKELIKKVRSSLEEMGYKNIQLRIDSVPVKIAVNTLFGRKRSVPNGKFNYYFWVSISW